MFAPGTKPRVHHTFDTDAPDGEANRVLTFTLSDVGADLSTHAAEQAQPLLLQRPPIKVMGKTVQMPRNVGLFSRAFPGTETPMVNEYRFSGQAVPSILATDHISTLIETMRSTFNVPFNAVLVNEYPAGDKSSIGAHSDDERGLDTTQGVYGINVYTPWIDGKLRKMVFRDKTNKADKIDLVLNPREIFVMDGPTFQKRITHEIPKAKRAAWRISFTFRVFVVAQPPPPITLAKREAPEIDEVAHPAKIARVCM